MAVEMVPVKSSAINAVGCHAPSGTIHVEFGSGGTHLFGPFTQREFERFRDAASTGKHFHVYIRAKAIQ